MPYDLGGGGSFHHRGEDLLCHISDLYIPPSNIFTWTSGILNTYYTGDNWSLICGRYTPDSIDNNKGEVGWTHT